MAETLQSYLQSQAQQDVQTLQSLHILTQQFEKMPNHLLATIVYALPANIDRINKAMLASISSSLPPAPDAFLANPYTLKLASAYGLNLAGEAAKCMERNHPDMVAQYPDFPWVALKRLRNVFSHPERYTYNDELVTRENKAVTKDIQKVFSYFQNFKNNPDNLWPYGDNDASPALRAGVRLFLATQFLLESHPDLEHIPITDTPECKIASELMYTNPRNLPMIVSDSAFKVCLNGIGDIIDRASCFYRQQDDSPLSDDKVKHLLHIRDRLAHFGTTLSSSDINITPKERKQLLKDTAKITQSIGRISTLEGDGNYTAFLTDQYCNLILGRARNDPAKCKLMDDFVGQLADRNLDSKTMNAYIRAAGRLIKDSPIVQSTAVIDYLLSKEDLKYPSRIASDPEGFPSEIKRNLVQFLKRTLQDMAPPGTDRIHR